MTIAIVFSATKLAGVLYTFGRERSFGVMIPTRVGRSFSFIPLGRVDQMQIAKREQKETRRKGVGISTTREGRQKVDIIRREEFVSRDFPFTSIFRKKKIEITAAQLISIVFCINILLEITNLYNKILILQLLLMHLTIIANDQMINFARTHNTILPDKIKFVKTHEIEDYFNFASLQRGKYRFKKRGFIINIYLCSYSHRQTRKCFYRYFKINQLFFFFFVSFFIFRNNIYNMSRIYVLSPNNICSDSE